MEIIDCDDEKWENFIKHHLDSSFFHTLIWRHIVQQVYGFEPIYLMAIEGDEVKAIAPFFYTESILFGRKIVSTPFNFYNGPLYTSEEALDRITDYISLTGQQKAAKYVEYKCTEQMPVRFKLRNHYWISVLDLPNSEEELFKGYEHGLRRNVKRRMKRAQEDGIIIKTCDEVKEFTAFYDVMVRTLRDKHNMIPQPYKLFGHIWAVKNTKILLAKKGDEIAGGMVLLFHNDTVTDAWTATNQKYIKYSPNSLLAHEAMKYSISKGYKKFDMGVTSPHQESLKFFKESWGCKSKKLPYYYDLLSEDKVPELDYHMSYKKLRWFFRFVPIWLIKKMSPIITRQLG